LTAATRLKPFIGVTNNTGSSAANKPRLGIYRILMSQNIV
jgi:hypothetical protein